MAARAVTGYVDSQPNAVLIVVDQQLADFLYQAAGRPLVPERLPAAAEVMRLAGFNGPGQRLVVHIAVHQQFAALIVGGDGRNQAVAIELRRELVAFLDLLDADALAENA